MARKQTRRRKTDNGRRGPRGPRGRRGAQGPSGPNGAALDRLEGDLVAARDELQVQFKRIAQLQAELDELRAELRARLLQRE